MIFCGDIALPFKDAVKTLRIPEMLKKEAWIGNLEGSLCLDDGLNNMLEQHKVFNGMDAIKAFSQQVNIKCFGLANNHLLDVTPAEYTVWNLRNLGINYVGGGANIKVAQKPVVLENFVVIAFGWENISCVWATDIEGGANPYNRSNCIKQVTWIKSYYPDKKIICFMHWNYELEKYPQPYDRQMAMDLIDMGVSAVIGCHAHRVQPVEFYKGRPIVYGLGNFLFCQGHYFDGQLRFPKFCEKEYAFEITNGGEKFKLHHFHYDSKNNCLEYVKSEEVGAGLDFDGKAEFTGFSSNEYEKWFKNHRVQKKFLPVFMAKESNLSYAAKSYWIKVRGKLINLLTKLNLKSANRAHRK